MEGEESKWSEAILSVLQGEVSKEETLKVKSLRKLVLLSMQFDEDDKAAKKIFKKTIKKLELEKKLILDADGKIDLVKTKKRKSKEDKDSRKKQKTTEEDDDAAPSSSPLKEQTTDDSASKNKPCKGNPQGVTRLFVGNLPFSVDEASLGDFLPGKVTHVKWITDKETGKFYGSAFIEMDNSQSAADAVVMAGQQLMGRPIKINYAPARPGDIWPPQAKPSSSGGGGQAGGKGIKAMSEKPENCVKLFIGNLSYDIDDDGITKFFASVDAEVKAVRWLHHKESGDFKGWYVL